MKKKRTITITSPKLKVIRNSIRHVISKAALAERGELIREKSKTNIDDKKRSELAKQIDKLYTSWKKSICVCLVCGSRTSNMKFNPCDKYCYCTKCYAENHEIIKERNETYKFL